MTADAPGRLRHTGTSGGHPARVTEPRDFGPFDAEDLPELDPELTDPIGLVDFGAVRVPVPADGTVTVEPTANGRLQAVHVSLPGGRLSVSALAAPKSARLWPDLVGEISTSLRDGGARVRSFRGEWGRELHARTGAADSVFIGVDGARWMLYGVATGPSAHAADLEAALRQLLRGTVVVRGRSPYPVRTVLPLVVPEHLQDAVQDPTAVTVTAAAPDAPAQQEAVGEDAAAVPSAAVPGAAVPGAAAVRGAAGGPEPAAGPVDPARSAYPAPPATPRRTAPARRTALVAADAVTEVLLAVTPAASAPLDPRRPGGTRSPEPPAAAPAQAPVPLWATSAAERSAADFGAEPVVEGAGGSWARQPAAHRPDPVPVPVPEDVTPTERWPAVSAWVAPTPLHDELVPTSRFPVVPVVPAVPAADRAPSGTGSSTGGRRRAPEYVSPGEGRRRADEPVDLSALVRERPGRRRARYESEDTGRPGRRRAPEAPPPSEPPTAPLLWSPATGRHSDGHRTAAPEPDWSRIEASRRDASAPALAFLDTSLHPEDTPDPGGSGRHHRPS